MARFRYVGPGELSAAIRVPSTSGALREISPVEAVAAQGFAIPDEDFIALRALRTQRDFVTGQPLYSELPPE